MTLADPAPAAAQMPEAGARFLNRTELCASGEGALRGRLLDLAEAGLAAADPGRAAGAAVALEPGGLRIGARLHPLPEGRRVFVVGAGKASLPIAAVLDRLLGARITAGLVAAKRGGAAPLRHIRVIEADHPIPSAASLAAARQTRALLAQVRPGDLVLACFTGGSSALFCDPVPGLSLEDLAGTSRVLLGCGAGIVEINAVRKHVSTVKGGRLARSLPAGATLANLTVSDVIGDRLDCITCPTVPDGSRFADAAAVLDRYGLRGRLPPAVVAHVDRADPAEETATAAELAHLDLSTELIVTADAACLGAADAARAAGIAPLVLSTAFEGESAALARMLIAVAREVRDHGRPATAPCLLIAGGETTVLLGPDTPAGAAGGPGQEFALQAALELDGRPGIAVLAMDTDGTDGPTAFAGGLADGATAALLRAAGHSPEAALARHDVTPLLEASGHALLTGHTGTNVNDLKLVLIAPTES
ncbi:glycerate kinase [Mangrovicoccus sp. HB161399]|uniref:glycerate kinase type-2 family protein n=1 Tax=Mangrovicoccus sp. HB161399 TaxID=2720392 RepID=UPI001C132372|nr:DUF4147 domain-containing protein [Mangrovicoccus sp. HB161399]